MTGWVCVHCGTPVTADAYDPWCPTCQTDTIGVQAPTEPMISNGQYRAICAFFTARGIVNRAERMRRLTAITGRTIGDYWELTATEAAKARNELGG